MSVTVGDWIKSTDFDLQESRWLLADTFGWSRGATLERDAQEINELQLEVLAQRLKLRKAQVPHAYVVGYQEFWGRKFYVGPGALIPRPETELIVEYALKERPKETQTVADLGAGSGCIGITLKLERPKWQVELVEISPAAQEFTRLNVREHKLVDEINIYGMSVVEWASDRRGLDLIVANPPYIDVLDSRVDPWVREHEPHGALFAEGEGLESIRSWLSAAAKLLNPGGQIIMEFGSGQRSRIQEINDDLKLFKQLRFVKDYSGQDRCLIGAIE